MWTLVGAGVPSSQVYWRAYQSIPFLVLQHGIGIGCSAFGGYWAARLYVPKPLKAAAIAGVMVAVFTSLQETLIPYEVPIPTWSLALSVLTPIPAFLIGAGWRRRRP